ncbi:MAG: FAD-dependent oxidoreductase [Actinobacteria bacterium]|nr:FAD-dependent oxidoreductase [Actinomycetota bacterium]
MGGVVVVGGGLGGLRAAESLRASGYAGAITVVGDEPHLPYNRPPLSKEALSGGVEIDRLLFRRKAGVDDVAWLLGRAAVASDLAAHTVTLADGASLEFDGLVIASGIRPRRLPIPGPSGGRHVLRTADDAGYLRSRMAPGTHVIIMGAGFIGCETAATARKLGCEVAIVAIDPEPMVRPLGTELGAGLRRRHEAHGVHFHLGHTIDAFHGTSYDVESVSLSDGTELPASIVIEAVGSVTNVEWLDGNGLDLSDGLLVDSAMQVDTPLAPVVAVGDIARHPNALFDGIPRRIEHWNMPTETGRRAGATLAALLGGSEPDRSPFTAMPSFWSDQYSYRLQSFGMPGIADRIVVVDGDPDGPCIVEYHDATGLIGVVGVDRTQDLVPYRKQLMSRGLATR